MQKDNPQYKGAITLGDQKRVGGNELTETSIGVVKKGDTALEARILLSPSYKLHPTCIT